MTDLEKLDALMSKAHRTVAQSWATATAIPAQPRVAFDKNGNLASGAERLAYNAANGITEAMTVNFGGEPRSVLDGTKLGEALRAKRPATFARADGGNGNHAFLPQVKVELADQRDSTNDRNFKIPDYDLLVSDNRDGGTVPGDKEVFVLANSRGRAAIERTNFVEAIEWAPFLTPENDLTPEDTRVWDEYKCKVLGWHKATEDESVSLEKMSVEWLTMKIAVNALTADPGMRLRLMDNDNEPQGFLHIEDTRSDKSRSLLVRDNDDGTVVIGLQRRGADVYAIFKDTAPLEKREPTFPTGLPCFELAPSVCCLDSVAERNEDLEGLKEFDFLFLPFPEIAIRVQTKDLYPDLYAATGHSQKAAPGYEGCEDDFLTFTASGELSLVTAADAGVETNNPMLFIKATLGDVCVFSHKGIETAWRLSDMKGSAHREPPPGFDYEAAKREYIVLMWDAITTLVRATNTMHGATTTERNTRFRNKNKQSKPQFEGPLGSIYISMTRLAAPDPTMLPDYVPGTHASPKAHKRRAHIHTVSFGIGHREKRKERFPMMWINRVEGEADPPARKYTVH